MQLVVLGLCLTSLALDGFPYRACATKSSLATFHVRPRPVWPHSSKISAVPAEHISGYPITPGARSFSRAGACVVPERKFPRNLGRDEADNHHHKQQYHLKRRPELLDQQLGRD